MNNVEYHERIQILPQKQEHLPSHVVKKVKVHVQSELIISTTTIDGNDNGDNDESFSPPVLSHGDTLLLSMLNQFDLESLLISISDSSDNSISQADLDMLLRHPNEDYKNRFYTFPVGTTIQYYPSSSDRQKIQPQSINEISLLRILQTKGLLCQNVQINDLLHSSTNSTPKTEGKILSNDIASSRVMNVPHDAFALCHTHSLYQAIVSSSPCRDNLGVLSKLNYLDLFNSINISDKAVWIDIQRYKDSIRISRGLRYTKLVDKDEISLEYVFMGHDIDDHEQEEHDDDDDDVLEHCPLTSSSRLLIQHHANKNGESHDLQVETIGMKKPLIYFSNEEQNRNRIGIERNVLRSNGIANTGIFQTRVYYEGNINSCYEANCNQEGAINVTVHDYYPNIVKPIFHSLRTFLVRETEGSNINEQASSSQKIVTELDSYDMLDKYIELSSDGSASLSITTTLPPKSSLYLQMDYNPRFLPFEQFPADPNRGFDVSPSYVTFTTPCLSSSTSLSFCMSNTQQPFTLYSNALLIMPPVPDMSMPFNVISLCGTFFAIVIGTSINLIIRKSSEKISDKLKGVKRKRPLDKIKDKLKEMITTLKQKISRDKQKQD